MKLFFKLLFLQYWVPSYIHINKLLTSFTKSCQKPQAQLVLQTCSVHFYYKRISDKLNRSQARTQGTSSPFAKLFTSLVKCRSSHIMESTAQPWISPTLVNQRLGLLFESHDTQITIDNNLSSKNSNLTFHFNSIN